MKKKPSLKWIAEEAGCTVGVVSSILNQGGKGVIRSSEKTRQKVILTARKHGIRPSSTPYRIALLSKYEPRAPMGYTEVMHALVSQEAIKSGLAIELMNDLSYDPRLDPSVNGVIAIRDSSLLKDLGSTPYFPVISINTPYEDHGVHSVTTDHEQQGYLATLHGLEKGHRRIAFLEVRTGTWGYESRLKGYRRALTEHGVPYDPELVGVCEDGDFGELFKTWLQKGVSLILNFHASRSLEVYHVLNQDLKCVIGEDISTIGLDDLPVSRYLNPVQTVIQQPLPKLAKSAVDMMKDLLADPLQSATAASVDKIMFSCKIIEGQSVKDLSLT